MMQYENTIILKNGKKCLIRNAVGADAQGVLDNFNKTHEQTDYLLTYPDETIMDVDQERKFLTKKENSTKEIEICAILDGRIVGMAGIESLGNQAKIRHRADFGISVEKACWNLGIGRALLEAGTECAKRAGYAQLELSVVSDNVNALHLYQSIGFTEYGCNPRGFCSRKTGWQELVLMRLELDSHD